MKHLLEAINRGILKGLNESNIELLADLDDVNLGQLDSIQTKSINSKIDMVDIILRKQLRQAIQTKRIDKDLKETFNNPNNFDKLKGIVKVTNKKQLKQYIKIGQKLFGNNGNFNWIDTSDITDMSQLFEENIKFNGHIELWDVSNVNDFNRMFNEARAFNQPIGDWDVSSATNMEAMFMAAKSFNQPIDNWNVQNVTNFNGMFMFADAYCQSLYNLNINYHIQHNNEIYGMFFGSAVPEEYYPKNLEKFINGVPANKLDESVNILSDLDDIEGEQLNSIQTKSVNNKISIYDQYKKEFKNALETAKITTQLRYIINTSADVKELQGFITVDGDNAADKLQELSKIIRTGMKLLGNGGNFNWLNTSNITNMSRLFTNIYLLDHFNGDISNWDVSNVTDMTYMFRESRFDGDISKWDVSNVKNMNKMFQHAHFTGDISNWDVSNVVDLQNFDDFTTIPKEHRPTNFVKNPPRVILDKLIDALTDFNVYHGKSYSDEETLKKSDFFAALGYIPLITCKFMPFMNPIDRITWNNKRDKTYTCGIREIYISKVFKQKAVGVKEDSYNYQPIAFIHSDDGLLSLFSLDEINTLISYIENQKNES